MGYTGDLPPYKKIDAKGKLRDPEGELLDHLNNKRPVQTASVMQVRKPIYKTSIRRAKNYKEITKKILSISDFKLLSENYNF